MVVLGFQIFAILSVKRLRPGKKRGMIAEKDVMDMRRCVIVGGAEIRTYDRVRQYFRPDDFFIYCDCGLRHQKALGAELSLIHI